MGSRILQTDTCAKVGKHVLLWCTPELLQQCGDCFLLYPCDISLRSRYPCYTQVALSQWFGLA